MSEWQQSSERAVLVANARRLRTDAARGPGWYGLGAVEFADAITAALALADRAAELEAALAEERAEAAVVQAWGESEAQSKVELFFMLSQHRAARAAHRNAAQQEGQGDGE